MQAVTAHVFVLSAQLCAHVFSTGRAGGASSNRVSTSSSSSFIVARALLWRFAFCGGLGGAALAPTARLLPVVFWVLGLVATPGAAVTARGRFLRLLRKLYCRHMPFYLLALKIGKIKNGVPTREKFARL